MAASRPKSISASAAKRLIEELDIRHPSEIDVELIAADRGLQVRYRPLAHEAGHLLRATQTGIITVDPSAQRSEKWRFVIAHELGHFLLHPTLDQFCICTDKDLNAWYRESGHEADANYFAAELLMPESLFKKHCDRNRPSLVDIRELSARFKTSLTATAIRFVEFCPEPCAIVHSSNGRVDWCLKTNDFRLFIRPGQTLTRSTYAGDIFAGVRVDDRPQLIDGAGWSAKSNLDVQEHSIMLGSYGSVLTMLWHQY